MKSYLIRRFLYMIPVVLGVCAVTFVLFRVLMGDPTLSLVGKGARKQEIREVRRANGYDRPLLFDFDASKDRRVLIEDKTTGSSVFSVKAVVENDFTDALYLHRRTVDPNLAASVSDDFPNLSESTEIEWIASRAPFPNLKKSDGKDAEIVIRYAISLKDGTVADVDADGADTLGDFLAKLKTNPALNGKIEVGIEDAHKGFLSIFDSQFFFHFSHLLRFDLGESYQYKEPISAMLWERMGASLRLTAPIFVISLYIQVFIAMYCAYKRGTLSDYVIVVISVVGISFPYLAVIAYSQLFLCYKMPIFPIVYNSSTPLKSYLLPIIIGVVTGLGGGVRFYRTVFLDEIGADYVRTARAKGVSEQAIMWKHVLRNVLIPVITRVVIVIPFLFLGSLLLERYFGIPGLGGLMVTAINNSDIPVINAMTYIGAILFSVGVLLTDICYTFADPRISLR